MDETRYKVLLIENDHIDQMAFERQAKKGNLPFDYRIAGSVSEARDVLSSDSFDVVVIDHFLGDGTAFDLLDLVKDAPVIFTTGAGDEELAVKAMKAGAIDYLIKDLDRNYLKILPETIRNAIRHNENERELKKYHENLENLVKQRTVELAAEKELLSVTVSSIGEGILAVDSQKRITLFNKVAEQLTGWKFEDAFDSDVHKIFQLVEEDTNKPVDNPVDKVFESGRVEAKNSRNALIAADGSRTPVSATAAPITGKDGRMLGVVMVFRNMLREREIDRMKTEFISLVSHELRSPLTSIKAYTETILSDWNMPEDRKIKFLQVVNEESDRLSKLVENILEISSLDSGPVETLKAPVNVAQVIGSVLIELQPIADEKGIQIRTDINEQSEQFYGDQSQIQSLIVNLVNNAIKYTPANGQVSVSIEYQDHQLVLSVADTGIGIPKKELTRIFSRFYRVHNPSLKVKGTGLGLAIVKRIVMKYDGRIDVESEVGRGTTFKVFLSLNNHQNSQVDTESGWRPQVSAAVD